MPNIGPMELIVVLAIALIIFGPKRLPEMGSSIGKGIREFKSSINSDDTHEEVVLPVAENAVVTEVTEVTATPVVAPTAVKVPAKS